ncbi:MAG: hypothetical protein MR611_03835 [Coriobacteriaceae bacterium]|nr:hypothetical protein [Coriobacteriaceae bacterium]
MSPEVADLFSVASAVLPVLACLVEWAGSVGISERHHSHHDTYVISSALSRSLAFAMVLMGSIGLMLGWLCDVGGFDASADVVMPFFSSFVIVLSVLWAFIRRYRTSLYDDFMDVRPYVGRLRTVRYDQIERMEWVGVRCGTGFRTLVIHPSGERSVRLPGVLDLEHILARIGRDDVLAGGRPQRR